MESGLQRLCVRVLGGGWWTRGDVVTGLVNSPIAQYAVIEVRRTEGPSERFVIAYSNEESLRDLIAGPSIVGCGFASREEAQAEIDSNFWTGAAWKRTSRGAAVEEAEKSQPGVLSAKRRLGAGFELTRTRRTVRGFFQAAVAACVLVFYSRNVVSTLIRSFVGGSS
jgi:hypothetical protein